MLLAGLTLPPCVQQKGPFFTWGLYELAHIPLCRQAGQFHGSSLLFEADGENFSPFPAPVVWLVLSLYALSACTGLTFLELLAELLQLTPTAGNYTN